MTETAERAPLTMLLPGQRIRVWYKNWRGELAIRNIEIDGAPHWGNTQYHPDFQWLVSGTDLDKNEHRVWALKDMEPAA